MTILNKSYWQANGCSSVRHVFVYHLTSESVWLCSLIASVHFSKPIFLFFFSPLSLSIVSEQQRKRHIFTLSATPPECAYSPTWKSIHTQKLQHTHSPEHVHATFMHFFVDNIKQLMWWFFEFLVESLCIQSPTKTYITSEYMVFSLNDQTFLHLVIWLFY